MEMLGPKTPVVVTGGASGIGRGTCLALAEQGRPVAIWDVQEDLAQEAAEECRARFGVPVHVQRVDLADEQALKVAVNDTAASLGTIGALAYCAAVNAWQEGPDDVGGAGWDHVMSVNLHGPAVLIRLLAPLLRANSSSAIALVSSASTIYAGAWRDPAYVASKTGLVGLARAMAKALAGDGIRVNLVTPGTIDTPLFRKGLEHVSLSGEQAAGNIPLGRLGQPSDLGRAIRFLLSDEASFITGTNIVVDGGRTCAG
jgi:NAD(P)-dependent dehydrogenase (short-subunit alcohol dehydrogenase family)